MMQRLLNVLLFVAILAPVALLLFYLDGCMGSSKIVSAIVLSKRHDAAWTEVHVHSDGNSSYTTTTYHPEEWSVEVYSIAVQGSFKIDISESDFNSLHADDRVNASVQIGRVTHAIVWSRLLGPAEKN